MSSIGILASWRRWTGQMSGQPGSLSYAGDEPPLRSELFSAEQMQQHGKTLAGLHTVSAEHEPDPLLARLAENEESYWTCAIWWPRR